MKIIMACDHVGYNMKKDIEEYLQGLGHEVTDVGAYSTDRAEYPMYGRIAADRLANGEFDFAVMVCGTGFGISLAANSVQGVRCVNCTDVFTARMSRLHNNANAIAFGARVIAPEMAKTLLDVWLNTEFEGGRHGDRVDTLIEMSKSPKAGSYKAN